LYWNYFLLTSKVQHAVTQNRSNSADNIQRQAAAALMEQQGKDINLQDLEFRKSLVLHQSELDEILKKSYRFDVLSESTWTISTNLWKVRGGVVALTAVDKSLWLDF